MTTEKKNNLISEISANLVKKNIPYLICAVTDEKNCGAIMAMNLQDKFVFGLAIHKIMETIARHSGSKPSEVAKAIYETELAFENWNEETD